MKEILNKIFENKYFFLVFPVLAYVFVSCLSYTTSPLYFHEGMDSSVFKSMGLVILKGKIPYVDYFDHKGPVLYFINALGQWFVSGKTGVFFLQVIGESLVFIFLFKIARFFVSGIWSFLSLLFVIIIYMGLYREGNQCEEWILICSIPTIYVSIRSFCKERINIDPIYGLVYGLCFGLTFYIRPTDAIALNGGIMTGVLLFLFFHKEWGPFVKNIIFFCGGLLIVSLPINLYFYTNNALHDLYYGLIMFNSKYAYGISHMLISCMGHHKLPLLSFYVMVSILIWNTKYKSILYIFTPVVLFSIILIGTRGFPHYLISYLIFFLLFIIFIKLQNCASTIFLSLIVLYCSSYAYDINFIKLPCSTIEEIVEIKSDSTTNKFYTECSKLFEAIPECYKDSIWNYNLAWNHQPYSSIFFHEGLIQCNMVPYYEMYNVDPSLKKRDDIIEKRPLYVLLTHDDDIISENTYPEICKFKKDYVFINSSLNFRN